MTDPKRKLDIKLNIAGRPYELSIDREREEIYRKAEREVNKWVAATQSQLVLPTEGYLALAALQLAVQKLSLLSQRSLDDDLDKLAELEAMIDNRLNKLG